MAHQRTGRVMLVWQQSDRGRHCCGSVRLPVGCAFLAEVEVKGCSLTLHANFKAFRIPFRWSRVGKPPSRCAPVTTTHRHCDVTRILCLSCPVCLLSRTVLNRSCPHVCCHLPVVLNMTIVVYGHRIVAGNLS